MYFSTWRIVERLVREGIRAQRLHHFRAMHFNTESNPSIDRT